MNNATGTEEEQGLEEGVSKEVEHTRAIAVLATNTETHEHIAKLADRREGQHAFEVGLYQGNRGSKDSGDATNPGYNLESRGVGRDEEREGTRHHINTGGNHSCRVDESTNRGRTFHGRGQPHMQRHLGRLTDGPTEDQDHRQGQQTCITCESLDNSMGIMDI